MEQKKGKVKEFVKTHGKEIIIVTGGILLSGVVGYVCGQHVTKKNNHHEQSEYLRYIYDVLRDIPNGTEVSLATHINHTGGYTPDELGKLGCEMILDGTEANQLYTHFIAIGKIKES